MRNLIIILSLVCACMGTGFAGSCSGIGLDGHQLSYLSDTLIDIGDKMVSTLQTDTLKDVPGAQIAGLENSPLDLSNDMGTGNFVTENLNDNAIDFISSFYQVNSKSLEIFQSRGGIYLHTISDVFHKYGIPEEMKYLAVIESGLNNNAVSRMGAVGAWQFMATTARLLGLTVSRHHDDRRNFYKSTTAAAKYLNQIHGLLQNWLLVVAAYDCGPGGVLKAINASGSTNFWDLKQYLPEESQKHVLKFLATAYILDRFTDFFGLNDPAITEQSIQAPPLEGGNDDQVQSVTVSGKFCLPVIASWIGSDSAELARLNPDMDSLSAGGENFSLNLPPGKLDLFKTNEKLILSESLEYQIKHNTYAISVKNVLSSESGKTTHSGHRNHHRRKTHIYHFGPSYADQTTL